MENFLDHRTPQYPMASLMLLTVSPMRRPIFPLLYGTLEASLIVGLLEPIAGHSLSRRLPPGRFSEQNPSSGQCVPHQPKGLPPVRDKPECVCLGNVNTLPFQRPQDPSFEGLLKSTVKHPH